MRFFDFSAAALSAFALVSGVVAQDAYGNTSSVAVVTITRTVSYVVQTTYATLTPTSYATPTPSTSSTTSISTSSSSSSSSSFVVVAKPSSYAPKPTGVIPPYTGNNGTVPVAPTGSVPSGTSPALPPNFTGAAGKLNIQSVGVVALAGMVGLMAL